MAFPFDLRRGSDAISPTAHYTGHVWVRNGLSHPALATREGRVFFEALAPLMRLRRALGEPTLEDALLERHRLIDERLTAAIDAGRVAQVVEIACGMSPRGWRFMERYGDRLTYVEADLPAMVARKRRALARIGSLGERHRVVELDALRDDGAQSLAALADTLDPMEGVALITEGLLTYFDDDAVLGMWRRFARAGKRFREHVYLSDLRLTGDRTQTERGFYLFLSAFVRGSVYTHFADEAEGVAALHRSGFDDARLHGGGVIHVIEAGSRPTATGASAL